MKKNNIYRLILPLFVLALVSFSCKETIWPEVTVISNADYSGVWKAQNYRQKTTYATTQDAVTNNYSTVETTETETVDMEFEFGYSGATEAVNGNGVKITTTTVVDGTAKTPVVKIGYFSVGETTGDDYNGKAVYINVWEKASNIHSGFANPSGEPYVTYTVVKKIASEMELSWVSYNNTAQNSVKYTVVLKK